MGSVASGKISSVLCDMDGLLLDTERIARDTFVEACRAFGIEPDITVYHRCIGTNHARTQQVLIEGYGRDFPLVGIEALWLEKYHALVWDNSVPLKPGARGLLEYLAAHGLRRAVVTSSRQESAERKLANAGLLPFFEFVLGGDRIINSKPHPEVYLTACRTLGEEPANCLALEDSDHGVMAAHSAGLRVVQVPDLLQPSAEVLALGHEVLPSLTAVEAMLRGL